MEKRTLVALAITFVVLGFYPAVLQHFYPGYGKTKTVRTAPLGASPASAPASSAAPGAPAGQKVLDGKEQRLATKKLELVFNENGGALRELSFKDYQDSETGKPIQFFSRRNASETTTLVELVSPDGNVFPGAVPVYSLKADANSLSASAEQNGVRIQKEYSFDGAGHASALTVRLENVSNAPKEFAYRLFAGAAVPPRHSIDSQYIEANFFGSADGKARVRHIKESKLGKTVESEGFVDWVAVKDRHFSVIVKPKDAGAFKGFAEGLGEHRFRAALVSPRISLAPGASASYEFLLYMGPTEIDILEPLGLGGIVNFGKLDGIGRFLVGALEMLNKVFRNYGLSILILTLLINLLLFPLTRQSFMSMKRMQTIQPHINKLREQYKKNPERLNKETMELYKKHKVNPFGGCLPMLIQMPVFIALYVALSKAVILVNAGFLWMNDLSSPDKVIFPFALPMVGNSIHVLPLLMSAAMFCQQKYAGMMPTEGQDPAMAQQQKMMAVMMPVIFGFIFYSMPSGLVLYWLTNTLFMTAYQLSLKRVTLT